MQPMTDPVQAIREADATGETAEIFADIRQVYRVGVVNLIWRHLATFPGALAWVWGAVRPLYCDGTIAQAAALGGLFLFAALPTCFVWLAFGAAIQHALDGRRLRIFNVMMGALLAVSLGLIVR